MTKYVKTVESWMASVSQQSKGDLGIEYAEQRRTLYQYVYYGSYKIAEPFSDSYKIISKDGKLVDVKEFSGKNIVTEALENTHTFTFSPASDNNNDWTGRLVTENSLKVAKKSLLLCLDGSPVVNDKTLSRYDYDELSTDKTYTIDLKTDGVLALFTEVWFRFFVMITKSDYMRLYRWSLSSSVYMMRYSKKCEEFGICSEIGDANVIFLETAEARTCLLYTSDAADE